MPAHTGLGLFPEATWSPRTTGDSTSALCCGYQHPWGVPPPPRPAKGIRVKTRPAGDRLASSQEQQPCSCRRNLPSAGTRRLEHQLLQSKQLWASPHPPPSGALSPQVWGSPPPAGGTKTSCEPRPPGRLLGRPPRALELGEGGWALRPPTETRHPRSQPQEAAARRGQPRAGGRRSWKPASG